MNEVDFTYCQMLHDESREVQSTFFVPAVSLPIISMRNRGVPTGVAIMNYSPVRSKPGSRNELAELGLTYSYLVFGTRLVGPTTRRRA